MFLRHYFVHTVSIFAPIKGPRHQWLGLAEPSPLNSLRAGTEELANSWPF